MSIRKRPKKAKENLLENDELKTLEDKYIDSLPQSERVQLFINGAYSMYNEGLLTQQELKVALEHAKEMMS